MVAAFVLAASSVGAQDGGPFRVDGTIVDRSGAPIQGAAVAVPGYEVTASASDGSFDLALDAGDWELEVRHPAYRTRRYRVVVAGDVLGVTIELAPALSVSEAISVTGVRAGDDVPVSKRNLDSEEIADLSYGQDVPQLLQSTPAVTWYSDSGIGTNYSYLSLRGIQQTRISMTFDGAPLNDPAEGAVYFNNFYDFLSGVDSIQVQRGVGTSSVGASAYGGSINFASSGFSPTAGGSARVAFGSYETTMASAGFQTGGIPGGFNLSGRASYGRSNGYRDSSGTEHLTFFLNAAWQGERSTLKLVSFSGREESQLAYLAVDPQTLALDPRFNPLGPDDRDSFGQDFVQIQYLRELGSKTSLTASLYYNGADGWFQLWDDPEQRTSLLTFGIDQSFVGSMVTVTTGTESFTGTFGAHYIDFRGDHTLHSDGERQYLNTGLKTVASAFAKAEYWLGPWLLFGDLQLRRAEFVYEGDIDLGPVDWSFADPKVGARRLLSPSLSLYASIGQAQREPTRMDLLLGEDNASVPHDLRAVRPERVVDLEAGLNYDTGRIALQANLYWMGFNDEIALTGELSEIGLPLRRNVDRSYRRGLEVDLRWVVAPGWILTNSTSFSHNRIGEWTQYYDVYDSSGEWIDSRAITHPDVPPLLTPELVLNQGVEWSRGRWAAAAEGRLVSESYLDNTGSDELTTPSYFNLDLRASVELSGWRAAGRPKLTVYLVNALDDRAQYPSGYSYQYFVRSPDGHEVLEGTPYYYPLAARNFVVTMDFSF